MRRGLTVARIGGAAACSLAVAIAPQATAAATRTTPVPAHVFVIMLEDHSAHSVIDQRDAAGNLTAPFITGLAHTKTLATNYYGVTHPSVPNYVAAISGSNWGIQDEIAPVLSVTNIVDQLEAHGLTWDAYMEAIDPADKLSATAPGSAALYTARHDPFTMMQDVRDSAQRMSHVKAYDDLATDLAAGRIGNFVWISPDQCNDMHGGVFTAIQGRPETPCPFGNAVSTDASDVALQHKADDFVQRTVTAITTSRIWNKNSVIVITATQGDFDPSNPSTGDWEDAAGCCDSPLVAAGDPRISPDWPGGAYGGGRVPTIVMTSNTTEAHVDTTAYNHYSLLATIEKVWKLGYLNNAADRGNVPTMDAAFAH
jgi:hypothetical protein